jgi:hypothetical protein
MGEEHHHSHVHPHSRQPEHAEILLLPLPLGDGLLAHMIELGEVQAEGVEQGRGDDDDEADDGVLSSGVRGNSLKSHDRRPLRIRGRSKPRRDEERLHGDGNADGDDASVLQCAMMRYRRHVDSPARSSPRTIHPRYQ